MTMVLQVMRGHTKEILKGGPVGLSRVWSGGGASRLNPRNSLDKGNRACTLACVS